MRRTLIALLVATGLALTACGGSGSSTPSSDPSASASGSAATGPHNAADVRFAQQMVPHHEQALKMVALAKGQDLDPDVQALVDEIDESQTSEVATMTGWLEGWGEQVPTRTQPMNGMLSTDQLDRLAAARGTAGFQQLWLYFMVQHHGGAIPMARTEIDGGANPEAIALAHEIERTQKKALGVMDQLLGP